VVSYSWPHELQILSAPEEGTLAVTLSQVLTVGTQARIEFRRTDDGSYVDVEMPRAEFAALKERTGVGVGRKAWLRARRVTRFAADELDAEMDPAAMI